MREPLRRTFDWGDEAELALFNLGTLGEVVDPPELRATLLARARAVIAQYDAPAPTTPPA